MDLLLRHKPYTPAMMVTAPETVAHFADSVEYLYGRGFRYLICSLNYGGAWDRRRLAELRRQYERLADWYYRETVKEAKFYFSPSTSRSPRTFSPEAASPSAASSGRSRSPSPRTGGCTRACNSWATAPTTTSASAMSPRGLTRRPATALHAQLRGEGVVCGMRGPRPLQSLLRLPE